MYHFNSDLMLKIITQDGSVYLLHGMRSPLIWTTTQMPTVCALRPPRGADARKASTAHQGVLNLFPVLQEPSVMQQVTIVSLFNLVPLLKLK